MDLAHNESIESLNIAGHDFGLRGALALGKTLQLNFTINKLIWDNNEVPLNGFKAFAKAIELNKSLTDMPVPFTDFSSIMKQDSSTRVELSKLMLKIDEVLKRNALPSLRRQKKREETNRKISASTSNIASNPKANEIHKLRSHIEKTPGVLKDEQKEQLEVIDTHQTHLHAMKEFKAVALTDVQKQLANILKVTVSNLLPAFKNIQHQFIVKLTEYIKKQYGKLDQISEVTQSLAELERSTITKFAAVADEHIGVEGAESLTNEAHLILSNLLFQTTESLYDTCMDTLQSIIFAQMTRNGANDAPLVSPRRPSVHQADQAVAALALSPRGLPSYSNAIERRKSLKANEKISLNNSNSNDTSPSGKLNKSGGIPRLRKKKNSKDEGKRNSLSKRKHARRKSVDAKHSKTIGHSSGKVQQLPKREPLNDTFANIHKSKPKPKRTKVVKRVVRRRPQGPTLRDTTKKNNDSLI